MNTVEQQGTIEHEELSDGDRFKLINELQMRVARELLAPKLAADCAVAEGNHDNDIMFKWVDDANGPSLSQRFREIVDAHPGLLEQYANKSDLHQYDQDAVVAKIEELLKA